MCLGWNEMKNYNWSVSSGVLCVYRTASQCVLNMKLARRNLYKSIWSETRIEKRFKVTRKISSLQRNLWSAGHARAEPAPPYRRRRKKKKSSSCCRVLYTPNNQQCVPPLRYAEAVVATFNVNELPPRFINEISRTTRARLPINVFNRVCPTADGQISTDGN